MISERERFARFAEGLVHGLWIQFEGLRDWAQSDFPEERKVRQQLAIIERAICAIETVYDDYLEDKNPCSEIC